MGLRQIECPNNRGDERADSVREGLPAVESAAQIGRAAEDAARSVWAVMTYNLSISSDHLVGSEAVAVVMYNVLKTFTPTQ